MTDAAILAALRASVANPDALEWLALVELCLSKPFTPRSHDELSDLLERWGRSLIDVDADEVRRMKLQLLNRRGPISNPPAREHDEIQSPEN